MAVTDVKRISHTGENNEQGSTRREVYRVIFDAVPDDIGDALTASYGGVSVPSIGDTWTGSTTVKCKRVGPVQQDPDSMLICLVPCEFSNIISSGSGVVTDDPLDLPADISFGFDVIERVIETDRDDNGILNSAGDKFDPPVLGETYRMNVTIERNVTSFNANTALSLVNTTNSNAMTVAGVTLSAGEALLRDYSAQAMYASDTDYIRERLVIALAATHAIEVADMGMEYIDVSDSNNRKRFTDDEGKPSTVPKFLNSSGDDGGGTERYLTFDIYPEASWASLGLPSQFPDT